MRVMVVLGALALAACQTPYQDGSGFKGLLGGVEVQRLDETTFQVYAHGNAMTSAVTIQNYVLRKAAETTLAAGYEYFVVVSGSDATRVQSLTTPGYASTTATSNINGTAYASPYSNTVNFNANGTSNATTTYTPPSTTTYVKPGLVGVIRMYHGTSAADPSGHRFWRAEDVATYMTPPGR